ncbi:exported hypothetical protein [Vibrio nigripulchritudo FTn2]|uniref:hypothetical protein n=1 Tax=Vibrio nigripulchritudo TaxID=28173 RepID=UPI0003B22642|nr:hypothetical protein [Vibrio nigripulchritudo]CCN40228.1 exported hypothetical protein [Vibrio nigripulchritudo FTn2]
MKILVLISCILFSTHLWANNDKLMPSEILLLNQVAYPTLGLEVVNADDEGLLMRSGDSRFFVKGVVSDLWDGVNDSLMPQSDIPEIPAPINASDYAMVYGEGDEYIRLFLTPSCKGCMVSLDTLSYIFDPFEHRIELVWLFNNGEDKKTVQHLLCRSPELQDIGAVIAESLNAEDVPCIDHRLVIGNSIARQQKVYALPYYTTKSGHFIQPITSNPFK